MKAGDAVQALAYAGVGSGLGAVVAAVIAARSGRGSARAAAADLLTEAAERVSRMNLQLDSDNRKLRRDLDRVTEGIDRFLNKEITSAELRRLVHRNLEYAGLIDPDSVDDDDDPTPRRRRSKPKPPL